MKIIKYNLCTRVNHGTDESPNIEEILTPVKMDWSEANMEIARREAYGDPKIYDDGEPDPADVPTQLDMIEAQVIYTALMTDTLLAEDIEDEKDIIEDESNTKNSTTSNTDIIEEESGAGTNTEFNDNINDIDGDVTNDVETPVEDSTNTDTTVIEDTGITEIEADSDTEIPVEGDAEPWSVTEGDSTGEEVTENPMDSGSESEGTIPVEEETVVEETLVEDQVDVVEEEVSTDV